MAYQFGWAVLQDANLVGELFVSCFTSNDAFDPVYSICRIIVDQHVAYNQNGSLFTLS